MSRHRARAVLAAALGLSLSLGILTAPSASASADRLGLGVVGFLGEQRFAPGSSFAGTTFGGISGLDRDRRTGSWVLISDDRSALQPARFYSADIAFDGPHGAISGVRLTGTTPFRRPDGATYPPLSEGDGTTVDPEDIRVDPITGRIAWSQEGERIVPTDGTAPTLIQPTVRFAGRDGSFVSELRTPVEERVTAGASGIRQNLGPEGLSFAARGALVVTAVEGPLLQDGPPATRTTGARSRIIVQDRSGGVLGEFAYPQEPLFADAVPTTGFAATGVSALLAVDDTDPTRFLVLERSFVTGSGYKARLYEVDLLGATDLTRSRTPIADARPVRKKLVADIGDLPVASVDNIEGMAWGPTRPDGSRTLVLVSDDNFTDTQVTQFVALAVGQRAQGPAH